MRRGMLIGTLTALCCSNQLSTASFATLHSDFQNHFILNPYC